MDKPVAIQGKIINPDQAHMQDHKILQATILTQLASNIDTIILI